MWKLLDRTTNHTHTYAKYGTISRPYRQKHKSTYCDGFAQSIARQQLGKHVRTHTWPTIQQTRCFLCGPLREFARKLCVTKTRYNSSRNPGQVTRFMKTIFYQTSLQPPTVSMSKHFLWSKTKLITFHCIFLAPYTPSAKGGLQFNTNYR
jgi:hypothetical protein